MSDELLDRVLTWAKTADAVRAIVMEGSHARLDNRVDRFSDYDLNLYVDDLNRFIKDDSWIERLGKVWAMEKLVEDNGWFSRLVLFEGGQDIDFLLVPVQWLHDHARHHTLPDEYQRGYKVLLDKDGIASQLPAPAYKARPKQKPSEAEFVNAVNVFWFELFHLVKYLHRGELWCVKFRFPQRRLLQMIEWHAQALHNWDYDTWMVGKFMEEWVEPELWQAFGEIFARFDKEDSWRAVQALIPLYHRIASEAAAHMGYTYPEEVDRSISGFILDNRPL